MLSCISTNLPFACLSLQVCKFHALAHCLAAYWTFKKRVLNNRINEWILDISNCRMSEGHTWDFLGSEQQFVSKNTVSLLHSLTLIKTFILNELTLREYPTLHCSETTWQLCVTLPISGQISASWLQSFFSRDSSMGSFLRMWFTYSRTEEKNQLLNLSCKLFFQKANHT